MQRMSGGHTRIVRLGNPRVDPALFDLVITTPQYPVPDAPNVVLLPLAMSRHRVRQQPTTQEAEWLGSLPRPHLLFALGGTTRYWRLPADRVLDSARVLAERATAAGGSLIIVSSPRTPSYILDTLEAQLDGQPNCKFVSGGRIRFAVLLADADENHITGDSVSMISEAVLAGKPVGVVPVELDREGSRKLNSARSRIRDIRRFWAGLVESGTVGGVETPRCKPVADPVETAAAAVRELLAR
jgi:mitochondrial fission protein ELM1